MVRRDQTRSGRLFDTKPIPGQGLLMHGTYEMNAGPAESRQIDLLAQLPAYVSGKERKETEAA